MPSTVRRTSEPMRFAEFFAGIGLVRMGLERAGWACVFANDIDETKQRLYEANFKDPRGHFRLGDVGEVHADEVPDIELATASFPCTDLSLAGRGDGLDGAQSSAYWSFLRIIDEMGDRAPRRVLLENVPALLRSNDGDDFRRVVQSLNELGYLADAMVLDARWFVPQSRPRLFIVAERGADATPAMPDAPTRARPLRLIEAMNANTDLGWSIADLHDPPQRSRERLKQLVARAEREASEDLERAWWSDERQAYLRSQLSPAHARYADEHVGKRTWTYATVFRRMRCAPGSDRASSRAELRTDGLAGCLRTPKGGSAKQILVKMGYGRFMVRYLTPHECARLMGADDFVIPDDVTDNQALFGFGDAVCVPAITWLAKHRLNTPVPSHAHA